MQQQQVPPGFENPYYQQSWQPPPNPVELPNATAVLVLGIGSIFLGFLLTVIFMFTWMPLLCILTVVLGLLLGIIAISMSVQGMRLYKSNPAAYTAASYQQLRGGRICGIVGLSVSGAIIVFYIILVIFVLSFFSRY